MASKSNEISSIIISIDMGVVDETKIDSSILWVCYCCSFFYENKPPMIIGAQVMALDLDIQDKESFEDICLRNGFIVSPFLINQLKIVKTLQNNSTTILSKGWFDSMMWMSKIFKELIERPNVIFVCKKKANFVLSRLKSEFNHFGYDTLDKMDPESIFSMPKFYATQMGMDDVDEDTTHKAQHIRNYILVKNETEFEQCSTPIIDCTLNILQCIFIKDLDHVEPIFLCRKIQGECCNDSKTLDFVHSMQVDT